MADFFPTHAPWFIGLAWASGGDFFKAKGDTWIQTLNNSASEKVLTFWDGLIKKDTFRLCPILPRNFTPHSVPIRSLHRWRRLGVREVLLLRLKRRQPPNGEERLFPNGARINRSAAES